MPNQNIKILVLAKSVDGGTGAFLSNFINIQSINNKFVVKTIILEKPKYRSLGKFDYTFFQNKTVYPEHYTFGVRNIITFYKEFVWVVKKIHAVKPKIILTIDIRCNLIALFCKLVFFRQLKVIATTHIDLLGVLNEKSTPILSFFLKMAIKIFYSKADKLIGVSKDLSKNLQKDFNLHKTVVTIYNGLKISPFLPHVGLNNRKRVIITVSRLDKQKDVESLIKAFKLLQGNIKNTKLWILGNGPKKQELENLVRKLQLQKRVVFAGWVNNVSTYLAKSSIFVLSSKREGMPYAIIEAMSQGIPIISTNSPYGPREILANGRYGILVPVGKPKIMSKAILELLTNQKNYKHFSMKAYERSTFFSLNKMLNGYQAIMAKMME